MDKWTIFLIFFLILIGFNFVGIVFIHQYLRKMDKEAREQIKEIKDYINQFHIKLEEINRGLKIEIENLEVNIKNNITKKAEEIEKKQENVYIQMENKIMEISKENNNNLDVIKSMIEEVGTNIIALQKGIKKLEEPIDIENLFKG